jgi:hypothetical protein
MRFLFGTILFVSFIFSALSASVYLKKEMSQVDRRGVKMEKIERNIFFPNSKLWYVTHVLPGEKNILKKKWGDYFFGLDLGREKGMNGGWSSWNFMEVYVNYKGRIVAPAFLPENIFVTEEAGAVTVRIRLPLSKNSKDSVILDIGYFPACKDWLFFKASIEGEASFSRIWLNCYPGNSDSPKERERVAITSDSVYNLAQSGVNFHPLTCGIVYGSNFRYENYGCLLVFQNKKVKEIKIPRCSAGISSNFYLKPDLKEFSFALGAFMDKPKTVAVTRFTEETQDIIYNFMNKIDWRLKPQKESFNKLCDNINLILEGAGFMGTETKKKFSSKFENLKKNYAVAMKSGESEKCRKCILEMERFKDEVINETLSKLK